MIAGLCALALVPVGAIFGGPVLGVLLFSAALLLLLLPAGVACPQCGHSIVMPVRNTFTLVLYVPSRRCRKCGFQLAVSTAHTLDQTR